MKRLSTGTGRPPVRDSSRALRDVSVFEPDRIPDSYITYYRAQLVPGSLSEHEFDEFVATSGTSLPEVFRLCQSSPKFADVRADLERHIDAIGAAGLDPPLLYQIPEDFGVVFKLSVSLPSARHHESLHGFRQWLDLYMKAGQITRQELVSMLPALFLDVRPGDAVLDCCADRGSESTDILERLTSGLLVANAIDILRCDHIVDQLKRLDMSRTLVVNHLAESLPALLAFDRVLCAVPCSGDGTFRKKRDAAANWKDQTGLRLHVIQRLVLLRGLQLLRAGGRCVYSTCSLNPVEDEAVVSSVIHEIGGAVSIVDVSDTLPGLTRSQGLSNWVVGYGQQRFETSEEVPEWIRRYVATTAFARDVCKGIERCMRFYPHQNDSGGFFAAVMQKDTEFEVKIQQSRARPDPWVERPFLPLLKVNNGEAVFRELVASFGMGEGFRPENLFAQEKGDAKVVFYLDDAIAPIVTTVPPKELRVVSCGSRFVKHKELRGDATVKRFPCFESVKLFAKFATKRRVTIAPADAESLLLAGGDRVPMDRLSGPAIEAFEAEADGGFLVNVEGSELAYGVMKGGGTVSLLVERERINEELFKLVQLMDPTPSAPEEEERGESR